MVRCVFIVSVYSVPCVELKFVRPVCLVWCSECCVQMSVYMLCELVMYVVVCDAGMRIASRLSELRSCVVSVLCSVISATVSKLRPMKLPVFFSSGRVL